jgi:hypothetical protein
MDEIDVADSPIIEWHGGGPEVWYGTLESPAPVCAEDSVP